jgi:predicted permease
MSVIPVFAFILVLLAIGRILRWRGIVPDNAPESLNLIVLYVCLPAAILLYLPKLEFDRSLLGLVAIPWSVLLATVVMIVPLAKWLGWDRGSTANLLVQIPLGNTSFIGYSLIPVLAGAGALKYAVVYDQLGSFAILATYGLTVVAIYAGGEKPTLWVIVRRIVTFPPFIAMLIALTVMPAEPPPDVARCLRLLADALLPIVVLALGMQLRFNLPRHYRAPLVFGLLGKLVLMPFLALGLATVFGLPDELRRVAVYMTAMPPMVTSGALLAMNGLAPELSAALIGFGIVASMLTLPLWHLYLSG